MSYDRECMRLARHFLVDYQLGHAEREQEIEALAQQIQVAVEAHLEALAHRRA